MLSISSILGPLREVSARSGEPIEWGTVSSVEVDLIEASAPLSDELREWYSLACPATFEIPWAIEWSTMG